MLPSLKAFVKRLYFNFPPRRSSMFTQLRSKVGNFINSEKTQIVIVALIILNALFLGAETFPWWRNNIGVGVSILDHVFIWIFLLEVVLKLFAQGFNFFKSGWNIFDFAIVASSLIPGNGALSALRVLRIFRTARLFGRIKNLRTIIYALLKSLPHLGWLFFILMIIYYIFAVLATTMFGTIAPAQFGSLGKSFYSLFSLMTMEGWQDAVDSVNSPYSRWVFIPFMLITSYIFLNLVVGIIVAAMEEIIEQDKEKEMEEQTDEIKKINIQLQELKAMLATEVIAKANQTKD